MGLIKAALGAAGGILADQWKEYFYCDAIPADVLVLKGQKRTSANSSNTKGSDNIISNGSVIAVADGQCMIIVEQGKVVELCAEPGEFTYDASTEPSLFDGGNLGDNIKSVFANVGKRFTFGGEAPKDQRVYYFNTKEIMGNKYGTPSPIPFRVVDARAGIDIDISVRCFGEYSYRITNPMLFYTNVCGNVSANFTRAQIDSQLKTEFMTALQPAFARISDMGIRYSSLPGHTTELAKAIADELTQSWKDVRGIEVQRVGLSSIKASDEDEAMLKEMQKTMAYTDPTRLAAFDAVSKAEAMKTAAGNAGGAAVGFMGMNMAQNAGGVNNSTLDFLAQQQQMQQMQQMQAAQQAAVADAAKVAAEWSAQNPANGWKCPACGSVAAGKFCPECGAKKPEEAAGWTCPTCGTVNKGKFCAECGTKKPAGEPLYKCDKCGWEPEDPKNPPKFCPECGDPFNESDIVS